jgi:hypothetical protein
MKSRKSSKILILLPFLILGPSMQLPGKPHGPDARLTGGFGELTCRQCHSGYRLDEGRLLGGGLEIEGIPEKYEAGKSYTLTLRISHLGQVYWGFELSARASQQGTQAGRLIPIDHRAQLKEESGVSYIIHTGKGTEIPVADRAEFSFLWIAPEAHAGTVLFNAAGNAANGDGKPIGDFVYTAGGFSSQARDVSQIAEAKIDEDEPVSGRRLTETPVLIGLPSPVDLNRGSIEVQIQHRFFQSLVDSTPGNAFGIDSGANISLGVNYALTNRFSMGVSRAREDQIISLTATHEIQTKEQSPWKMSLHGGVTGKGNFEYHYSPFIQLATVFDYRALRINLTPTMVFNSRDDSLVQQPGPDAVNPDQNSTFALGVGADFALHRRFSIMGEYVPRLAGFGGFFGEHSQLGGGVAIRTWGHVFTILVSRSRNLTPTKYAVDADFDGVSLGFNIYRRIR